MSKPSIVFYTIVRKNSELQDIHLGVVGNDRGKLTLIEVKKTKDIVTSTTIIKLETMEVAVLVLTSLSRSALLQGAGIDYMGWHIVRHEVFGEK